MSELDKIKDKKLEKKPSVFLEDVDITAIAMTSGAGACSQMNDPYILKSKDLDLTDDQIEILKEIGEYDNLMDNIKKQKEETMSEELKKELENKAREAEELQKKLDEVTAKYEAEAIEKATISVQNSIKDFEIEEDLKKSVTAILVGLENESRENIIKAFTILKDFKKEEEVNPLQKELQDEAGATGEPAVEKSLVDRINEYRK